MSILAVKMLLKAIGLNADALEGKAIEVQKVIMEFDLNELRSALQMVLDYKRDQAQNELRMKAIMHQLGIADPCEVEPPMSTEDSDTCQTLKTELPLLKQPPAPTKPISMPSTGVSKRSKTQ